MNEIADLISDKNDPQEVFQLLDVLGQGSYGSVSKALHKETGELYAVKILPATSTVEIASIKKQIGILKQCDDDHIVKYFGSYFKDNNLWIVMEYCIAGSITDIMQITKKKLNENEIASILESALKGLKYLHQRKKIHRDIKAANILLDQKGNAKLSDFGVSASAIHTNARFRTHIGSPYWMSPQIIKYSEYDYKTDIWSLGITAIQLAEGQVPNANVKPFMAIFQIKSNPVQSFKEPSLWSVQFNDFVRQCLQINPTNRPQARQLLQHPFIRKFSKGQRLLAQLVLNSMQEIQQFRMTQSRNSSFAQIIVDQAREGEQETKTLVQNSHNGTVKHSNSQFQGSLQAELQGSMIILDSHRSQSNSCTDSVVINENITDEKKQAKASSSALANYINGMKQIYNVELKCAEMLIKAINRYDQQLIQALNNTFKEFKNKVENDLKSLKELKQKNPSLNIQEQQHCKILQCESVKDFLFPYEKSTASKDYDEIHKDGLLINSKNDLEDQVTIALRHKNSINSHLIQKMSTESRQHYESTEDRQSQFNRKYDAVDGERNPLKSFLVPSHNTSQSGGAPFKKQYIMPQTQNTNAFDHVEVRCGQSQGDILKVNKNCNRNSSRIIVKRVDNFITEQNRTQWQQMANDPDIVDYLKAEFILTPNGIDNANHTKSNFCPTYACGKSNTREVFRQQRSTQQSISKSKNKSVKNLKAKKKTRVGN